MFYRHRSDKVAKGGIAIAVNKDISDDCVIIDKGSDNEWMSIQLNKFSPPIIAVCVYGHQDSQFSRNDNAKKWSELYSKLEEYQRSGKTVITGGDFNAAIGCNDINKLTSNHTSINHSGIILNNFIKDNDCHLANSLYPGQQITHIDRSNSLNRSLDYLMCNKDIWVNCVIDENLQFTPYRILKEQGHLVRKYSDHRAVVGDLLVRIMDDPDQKVKQQPRFIVNKESLAKFKVETEAIGDKIIDMVNKNKSNETILNSIRRDLNRARYKCFDRIKNGKKSVDLIDDHEAFTKWIVDIEKEVDNISNLRLNNKVWHLRNNILSSNKTELFAMENQDGDLMSSKDDIFRVLRNYNHKLLSRVQHSEGWKSSHNKKSETLDQLQAEVDNMSKFDEPNFLEFKEIMSKLKDKNKNMFREFNNSSTKYHVAIFKFLSKVYEDGDLPSEFTKTELIPLYKKNNPRDPQNYRYLHVRSDISRVYESMIYKKLEPIYDNATPEAQLGGMKSSNCEEHLIILNQIIRHLEANKEAACFTAVDVVKCFDRIHNDDCTHEILIQGGDKQAVLRYRQMNKVNIINIQGDDQTFTITDGQGQGGVNIGRAAGLMIAALSDRNQAKMRDPFIFCDIDCTIKAWVDDQFYIGENAQMARQNGKIVTETFDELALSAHPDKSVNIIVGDKNKIESLKTELTSDPVLIQQNPIKNVESERYLGSIIKSGGYQDTLEANLNDKRSKAFIISQKIRSLIEDKRIERVGRLKAASLLIQSQLIPVLIYATKGFTNLTKSQYEKFEKILSDSIKTILSLPECTNRESMLHLIDNIHLEQWIDAMKLKFWVKIIHRIESKKDSRIHKLWQYQLKHKTKNGVANEISKLCKKYEIEDINFHDVSDEVINFKIKSFSKIKSWTKIQDLSKSPNCTFSMRPFTRQFWELSRIQADVMSMVCTGNIITRKLNPHLLIPMNRGSTKCLFQPCFEDETLSHIVDGCEYYDYDDNSYYDDPNLCEAANLANKIIFRNQQRIKLFKQPLFYRDNMNIAPVSNRDLTAKEHNEVSQEYLNQQGLNLFSAVSSTASSQQLPDE